MHSGRHYQMAMRMDQCITTIRFVAMPAGVRSV